MGFFSGITELAFSPVKVVTKTTNKVFDEEWEVKDALICEAGSGANGNNEGSGGSAIAKIGAGGGGEAGGFIDALLSN